MPQHPDYIKRMTAAALTKLRTAKKNLPLSLSVFFISLIVILAFASPKIIEYRSDHWHEELDSRQKEIESAVRYGISDREHMIAASLRKAKSAVYSNLKAGKIPAVIRQLNSFKAAYGPNDNVAIAIYDESGALQAWNRDALGDTTDIFNYAPGRFYFCNAGLSTWLTLCDTIQVSGKVYYAFASLRLENRFQVYKSKVPGYGFQGFTDVLTEKFNTAFNIDYTNTINLSRDGRKYSFYLKNLTGDIIGSVTVDKPSREVHLNKMRELFTDIQSVLVILTVLSFAFSFYGKYRNISGRAMRLTVLAVFMVFLRYLIFHLGIPSEFIDADITNPAYFASTFGSGIVKSPLEFFVTAVFFLVLCIRVYNEAYAYFQSRQDGNILDKVLPSRLSSNAFIVWSGRILFTLLFAFLFFIQLRALGASLRSVVFDSSLRYFKNPGLIPSFPVALMHLNILLLGISSVLISVVLLFVSIKYLFPAVTFSGTEAKKYLWRLFVPGFVIYQLFGFLYDLMQKDPQGTAIIRIFYIALIFLMVYRTLMQKKKQLFRYVYFALISSLITVSLMNYYNTRLEREALKIAAIETTRTSEEWTRFLINETLLTAARTSEAQDALSNGRTAFKAVAFNLWSHSALRREALNSSFEFLDSTKKLLGGFYAGLKRENNRQEGSADGVRNKNPKKNDPVTEALRQFLQASETNDRENGNTAAGSVTTGNTTALNGDLQKTGKMINGIVPVKIGPRLAGYLSVTAFYNPDQYRSDKLPDFLTGSENSLSSTIDLTELKIFGIKDGRLNKTYGDIIPADRQVRTLKDAVTEDNGEAWIKLDINGEKYITYILKEKLPDYTGITAVAMKEKNLSWSLYNFLKVFFVHVLLILTLLVLTYVFNFRKTTLPAFSFRTQLLSAFLIISLLPLVFLAVYNRSLTEEKNSQLVLQNLRRIEKNLESYLAKHSLDQNISMDAGFENASRDLSLQFSVYSGKYLVYSSQEEFFESGFLSRTIAPGVYNRLINFGYREFFNRDNIQNYPYSSFYSKVILNNQEYIFRVDELFNHRVPLSMTGEEVDVFLFGSYSFATLLVVILSALFANRISSPVRSLTRATGSVAEGDLDIQMPENNKGEIGDLMRGFNLMVRRLKKSQLELAEMERETAWKEMARQVAHEIKNPLTPMKLAMQQLIIAYKDRSPKFDAIFDKVSSTVISQIDTLSNIAGEFSGFARMPKMNLELLALNTVIEEAANLFIDEKVDIQIDLEKNDFMIEADKDQLKRVIINIIRNSLQAGATAITISATHSNGNLVVSIKDNGTGIPPENFIRVFEENFTTKEKGMGLGLNMAKKFVESIKGKIYISESSNDGTVVTIELLEAGNEKR